MSTLLKILTQSRKTLIALHYTLERYKITIATQVKIINKHRPEDIQPEVEDKSYQAAYSMMLQKLDSALKKDKLHTKDAEVTLEFMLGQCSEITNRAGIITNNDNWIGIWKGEEPIPNETFHGLLDRYLK